MSFSQYTVDCYPFIVSAFSYVVVMPKKRQALVEYEDMNGSSTAVTYAADNQVYIAGHPAFINYSTSQKISRPGDSDDSRSVNNVLLLTIMNPIYPITTVNAKKTFFNLQPYTIYYFVVGFVIVVILMNPCENLLTTTMVLNRKKRHVKEKNPHRTHQIMKCAQYPLLRDMLNLMN